MFCFVARWKHNTEREKLCSCECQVDIDVGIVQMRELVNILRGTALYEILIIFIIIIIIQTSVVLVLLLSEGSNKLIFLSEYCCAFLCQENGD